MNSPIRVLELRSVWGTGGGPDKTILAGAHGANRSRIATTVCYIRDARDVIFAIDRRAKELSLDYVEIRERHSFDRSIWPALRALVRQRGIQIVHAHDYKTDLLAWALGRWETIVPLSTAHGWAGESVRQRLYYAVEKRLLARFPHLIAVSNPIKAELVRTGSRPERISVVPNAIDHRTFVRDPAKRDDIRRELGFAPGDLVIGAVGRLESEKRFDILLQAFATLHETRPQLQLAIAGDGSCRAHLESAIGRLARPSSCRLLGHRTDVATLHHAFDLFVQSSEREGTSNAVLEAMALETPIVATDVGGTSELVTDGIHGLILPPGDRDALARAMDRALSDPEASATRARAARRRVETELSFDRRMERVEKVYRDLLLTTSQRDAA